MTARGRVAAFLVATMAAPCFALEIEGRIEPAAPLRIFLRGADSPFETSTTSSYGHFHFRNLSPGTYTLDIVTLARGEAIQTIDLTPGTVDASGRLSMVVRIDEGRLEFDRVHTPGATISVNALSIPDRALREYAEASRCLSRRDADAAAEHLRQAVEIAPRYSAAWNQLGTIAYQSGHYADAETWFRRAHEAEPDEFEPLVNLGGVLLNLNRPREALELNLKAVARRPGNALANAQLGLTYYALKDPALAEKYLTAAIRLDPAHFSNPQLVLANIYLDRGDGDAALASLRQFLELHPDAPQSATIRRTVADLSR